MKIGDIMSDIIDNVETFADRKDVRDRFGVPQGLERKDLLEMDEYFVYVTYVDPFSAWSKDVIKIPWENVNYLDSFPLDKLSEKAIEYGLVSEGEYV